MSTARDHPNMQISDYVMITGGLVFVSVMLGLLGTLGVPASMRLAGPVLCPDGSSAVVAERPVSTSREGPGGTRVSTGTGLAPGLFCVDEAARAQPANQFAAGLVLTGMCFGVGVVLVALAVARSRWRSRAGAT